MNLKELKLKIMNEMIRLRNEGLVEQDCVMDVLEDTIDPFVEERERQEKCDDVHLQRIAELEKENAELTCQMKRNFYCYSCKNATEKCYRKEISCPCGKYESYKDENAELKELHESDKKSLALIAKKGADLESENAELKEKLKDVEKVRDYWKSSSFDWRHKCMSKKSVKVAVKAQRQLTKAKEIITNLVKFDGNYKNDEEYQCKSELYNKIWGEAEQFLNSEVEK